MENSKEITTPMSTSTKLDKDATGKNVDSKPYKGMIGRLLNLTASKLTIICNVCLCACFQALSKESHLYVVKRIIRYFKSTLDFGLYYPKNTSLIYWDIVMQILPKLKLIKKVQVELVNSLIILLYLRLVRNKIV